MFTVLELLLALLLVVAIATALYYRDEAKEKEEWFWGTSETLGRNQKKLERIERKYSFMLETPQEKFIYAAEIMAADDF